MLTSFTKPTDLNISGQTAGDILYFNGANWIRLAKGTAIQTLRMNAGATAPQWDTISSTTSKAIIDIGSGNGSIIGSIGYFNALYGTIGSTLSYVEASVKNGLNIGGTFKNAMATVNSNPNTNSNVLTLRKNTADTAIVITVTALTTGIFSDLTNTVTAVSTDLINWKSSAGATADTVYMGLIMEFDPT